MEFRESLKNILLIKDVSALNNKSTITLLEDFGAFDDNYLFRQILESIIEMGIGVVLLNVFSKSIIDDKGATWDNLKESLLEGLPYDDFSMNLFFENLEYALLAYISNKGNVERDITIATKESLGQIWADNKGGKYSLDKKILYDASEAIGRYLVDSNNVEVYSCAFRQNNKITDIWFSKNLKTIGACAFQNCSKLSNVRFSSNDVETIGEHAFGGCFTLEEVYLPGKIQEVTEGLFHICTNLVFVHIPKSVKSIGRHAFKDCHCLQFVVVPDNVISIGDDAFCNCNSLSYVILPLGLNTVGERVFDNCKSLRNIYIPEGTITKFTCLLPNYSHFFREYSYSKSLSTRIVGKYKFYITRSGEIIVRNEFPLRKECDLLEINSYKKGNSKNGAFIYKENEHRNDLSSELKCKSAAELFPKRKERVLLDKEGNSRSGASIYKENVHHYYLSPLLKYKSAEEIIALGDYITVAEITINNGKDWIPYAYVPHYESFDTIFNIMPSEWFYESTEHNMSPQIMQSDIDNYVLDDQGVAYSKDLKRLIKAPNDIVDYTIQEGVEVICDRAFESCHHLQRIKMPTSVVFIGYASFRNCDNLESIEMPINVKSIGSFAFTHCHSIRSFQMNEGLISIGDGAFYGCRFNTLVIPETVLCIGKGAFSYCRKLEEIKISPSVIYIGKGAFYRTSWRFQLNNQIPSRPHFNSIFLDPCLDFKRIEKIFRFTQNI